MRSPRARHHGGGKRGFPTRKYDDDDGYSAYESDRRTPFSEYESRTNRKRTVYSEYTTDADYSDAEDRSSYSEYDNGKHTPYSEYITEYSDETDDDRMSGTLGIARNQYCTTLNGLVNGSESGSSESSYSQSTFASDFDRMCNANVNTNCMATLFNRNTDVPGTIHCGHGEHSGAQQKMSLPIPLHYMDHLVPSKQELNSALDNFAQKFDTGDEVRPGFPQVYKSLFEANLSQTASNEDEESAADYMPRRKVSDRNRSQDLTFTKPKQEALSEVEKDKDPGILSPPSHIIIRDEFTAVSSAESFGFAPETQKLAVGGKHKKDRREGNKRLTSPRHSSPRNRVLPHRQSPRHTTSHRPSPRHDTPERQSSRHASPHRNTGKSKPEYREGKPDAPIATRHGLDRLMHKQATSPSKRLNVRDEGGSPAFNERSGLKSPLCDGRVLSINGKSDDLRFPHIDETRQDADTSKLRQLTALREASTSRSKTSPEMRSKSYRHGIMEEESPSTDERLAPANPSIDRFSSTRIGKHGYNGMTVADDTNKRLWRNSANSIPYALSLKPTQTAVSELTGEGGDFGEKKSDSVPLEAIVGRSQGNAAVNVHILSLKPTQTAVSELTGEAGDFAESRALSAPLDAFVAANSRAKEEPEPRMADDFGKSSNEGNKKLARSRLQTPSRRNEDLANGMKASKLNTTTHHESKPAERNYNDYSVTRRPAPNKKAETLDKLEDALMGSRKSFSADQKPRRDAYKKKQFFKFEESRSDARWTMDGSDSSSIGNVEKRRKQEESAVIRAPGQLIEKAKNNFQRKPTQLQMDSTTLNSEGEPFETKKVALRSMEESQWEEGEELEKGCRNVQGDVIKGGAMHKALSLHPEALSLHSESLSGCYKDLSDKNDNNEVNDKEMKKLGEDDPTTLSALDNEISLLESQITGLEKHDQLPDIHLTQVSMASDYHCEDQVIDSKEALVLSVEAKKTSDDNNIQPRLPIGQPKPPSVLSEPRRKTSGNYHHSKPPLVPTQQNDQKLKRERKQEVGAISKIQNKSTDATLVTAPTVMTMDTPFTMDAPLVVSQTTKESEERKRDRNSNMLVATAIALPCETGCNDRMDINSPFLLVFIVGTTKYFTDVVFIILAWMRHFSSMGFIQRQQGRVQVGLMVPPIADDDVLYEQQLQKSSLGGRRFASPSPEEPGILVDYFVPEIWAKNESTEGKIQSLFPPLERNSIWNRLFYKMEVEATTH